MWSVSSGMGCPSQLCITILLVLATCNIVNASDESSPTTHLDAAEAKSVLHHRHKRWFGNIRERIEEMLENSHRQCVTTSCWNNWGSWGSCTASCGATGTQTRRRSRKTPATNCAQILQQRGCPGGAQMSRSCRKGCGSHGTKVGTRCSCAVGWMGSCCNIPIMCQRPGPVRIIEDPCGRRPCIHPPRPPIEFRDPSSIPRYLLGPATHIQKRAIKRLAPGVLQPLPILVNSNLIFTPDRPRYNYGAVVQYGCPTGWRLTGPTSTTCIARNRWSATPIPTCTEIICPDPGTPANGGRSLTNNFKKGSQARYTCNSGYRLVGGAEVRTCGYDSRWSGSLPTCQRIVCAPPPGLSHGSVAVATPAHQGAVATYTCNHGYHLSAGSRITCQATFAWSGGAPTCQQILCPTLAAPSHGRVMMSSGRGLDAVALYTCDTGYGLGGASERTCVSSSETVGAWDGQPPSCNIVRCPAALVPNNGAVTGTTITYETSVSYVCHAGYRLQGDDTSTCQADATWSKPPPTCHACARNKYKPAADAARQCQACPANTRTLAPAAGARALCVCEPGWRGPAGGPCERITCHALSAPNHAVKGACGSNVGNTCSFSCTAGHVHTSGDAVMTCSAHGAWQGRSIVCTACPVNTYAQGRACVACPAHTHTAAEGSTQAQCVCDSGYGRAASTGACSDIDECLTANGGCQQSCENLPGSFRCRCNLPGFEVDADNPSRCVATQQCPALPAPQNGGFVCVRAANINTQRCQVKCNPAFEHVLSPSYFEQCGPDTNWQWSYALNGDEILPCTEPLFEDFHMEAECFYFVDDCAALTPEQLFGVRADFLAFLQSQNLCLDSGLFQCKIDDVTVGCGYTSGSGRKRRDVMGSSLVFQFSIKLPDCPECPDSYGTQATAALTNAGRKLAQLMAPSDPVTDTSNRKPDISGAGPRPLPPRPRPSVAPRPQESLVFGGVTMRAAGVRLGDRTVFMRPDVSLREREVWLGGELPRVQPHLPRKRDIRLA